MNKIPNVLIMAGGVGSRFWPSSREDLPKQFLDITGSGKSLIRETFDRFVHFIPADHIYVITNQYYREQTLDALPDLHEANLICEPSRNNTAAAIALASLKLSKTDPQGICIVAPADHIIHNTNEFIRVLKLATSHADQHASFITLGIKPTRPDTGYGYIESGKEDTQEIRKVVSFREKPDLLTAIEYLEAGNYVWNSGLFIWRFDAILNAFNKYAPQIFQVLSAGNEYYNTPQEERFLKDQYPITERISVDYAILEKADNVYTIPCDLGWSDLGTWNSLFDISEKDDAQNAALTKPVYLESTNHCLILSKKDKLVVIKGLDDYIIVDTDDCLMIYPKSEEQSIRQLKERLSQEGLDSYL